jgi:hypothetical protein
VLLTDLLQVKVICVVVTSSDETVGIMLVETFRALLQDFNLQLAYRDGAAEHVLLNTI